MTLRLGPADLDIAIRILQEGGVLAFPTDTVYGLGCLNPERLYEVKERPPEKRIAYLVAEPPDSFPEPARKLAAAFWPGALTIVAGDHGYRMPDLALALALLRETGPLPTTSANMSGEPATSDPQAVWDQLNGRIDALLDGGPCPGGRESTVVGVDGHVFREGAIPIADIERVLG